MPLCRRPLLFAAVMLWGAASAVPAASQVAARATSVNPTDLWVTIDESGQPKTVTPVATTVSGTTTILSGAPNDVTGSIFTQTNQAEVTTSTGSPPMPTATATGGAGSFPVCHNMEGQFAPFCLPAAGANLNPGTTYYVTWDPNFFPTPNTTVKVTGDILNATADVVNSQAFSSGNIPAAWSFYAWTADGALLNRNISLTLHALAPGSGAAIRFPGPIVLVANPPPFHQPPTQPPVGPALYIGLPTIAGFIVLVLVGGCIWNRTSRRIGLGNVMSRARHGYGIGKSRTQRLGVGSGRRRERKDQAIRLMERNVQPEDELRPQQHYRDASPAAPTAAWHREVPGRDEHRDEWSRPRRDSDSLGSLAGTPTEERTMDFGHRGAGGNAFREELSRQDRERH